MLLNVMLLSIKGDLQVFINDYGVPVVAAFLIIAVGSGIVKNMDLLVDKDGSGSRREGIMNVIWIVGYVIVAIAVLAAVGSLIANIKMTI